MNEFGSGHGAAAAAVTNASRTPNVEKLEEKYKTGGADSSEPSVSFGNLNLAVVILGGAESPSCLMFAWTDIMDSLDSSVIPEPALSNLAFTKKTHRNHTDDQMNLLDYFLHKITLPE